MHRVGIIGSAGRGEDRAKMSRELYKKMYEHIVTHIDNIPDEIILVSGGASWVDHLAVSLYKVGKPCSLELHLPAKWDFNNKRYLETTQSRTDAARVANYHHHNFSLVMQKGSSLESINDILQNSDVKFTVYDGFKPRNLAVGKVDTLLAYTWYEGATPKPKSGTLHTWNNSSSSNKIHTDIGSL